ncbi:MAG: type II toxin-antitoxin system VapC family toxin [Planctomycetes bacterium]|nr:type II toxin-antitoxin system VapC family toxin [Planctomycetota bacterium]
MNRRCGVDLRAKEARLQGSVVGTCEVVVAELYFGAENSVSRDDNLLLLERTLAGLKCWPLTRAASQEFGRVATSLKRQGRVIGRIDILIASIALTLPNCTVVTTDKDLLAIPGLAVVNWAEG